MAWQGLYAADPASALGPEESWLRWAQAGKSAEQAERRLVATAAETRLRAAAEARFSRPRDILEDD